MNDAELSEIQAKETRVREYLDEHDCDGLLLGRKDDFSWFTCGGSNEVIRSSDAGFAILLITRADTSVIAQVMDGQRVIDEELNGYGVKYVPLRWYEPSPIEKAAELIRGMKVVSDVPCDGATFDLSAVRSLHSPLTAQEIKRLRVLGAITDEILREVADTIEPGMTELEIAGMLSGKYERLGTHCDVLLIGSDERVSAYRHPVPTEKRVRKYVLLHSAICGWGLHANVTRLLHFGPAPAQTQLKFDAACTIQAASIAMSIPGQKFRDILEVQKRIYAQVGYAEEWRNHYQGAVTGYMVADPTGSLDPLARISTQQAHDWFVTITGVKVEELSLHTPASREVASAAGHWPTRAYSYEGQSYELPQILVR